MFNSVFSNKILIWQFAKDTAVLLCISLAITPAFRMRFWNIGAEGQTLIGALAAVTVAFYLGNDLPNWLLLIFMFAAAVIAGAIWAFFPAVFKAKWNANETLFTLMMNYVAMELVNFFISVWVKSGSGTLAPLSVGNLPTVFNSYFLLVAIVFILTVIVYIYLNYTKQGYEISVVGESENTAHYIGIKVNSVIIRTMLISGAICGIAGFLIVSALDHTVSAESTVGGLGFIAIMVSWLAKFNPLIMIGTSAFIAFLRKGTQNLAIRAAFPDIVVGMVLFFIIGCEFFINYKIKFRNAKSKGGKA
jgi:simple sugar transport system permease protein